MSRPASIQEIFTAARKLPPDARPAFLAEACGADAALRREVEDLLAHLDPGQDRFATESMEHDVRRDLDEAMPAGFDRIGPYRILGTLGEGGMGRVYLAEQTEPVHRRVAIKTIRTGLHTEQVVARFEAERQALAMLDHPGVARLIEAGADEVGRPFLVMELVDGEPITRHCDRHRLSISARLGLFVEVCRILEHAHQRGVLHRDIKPSNVLVTPTADGPVPRVIDFGIAKILADDGIRGTLLTEAGQLIGTPEYMSPEQLSTDGVADVRSDVYALGVLLHELVVGSRPFERQGDGPSAVHALLQEIAAGAVTRPSAALAARSAADAGTLARLRATDPRTHRRTLRGDLDWIMLKALDRERDRRYASVSALADDVVRLLRDLPVSAAPPSTVYRLRKLVSRNRRSVAVASVLVVTVVAGAVATAWQAIRATREVHRIETLQAFLVDDILRSPSPWVGNPRMEVRELLARAADRTDERFADDPTTRARLHHTLGLTYGDLGLPLEARTHLETALRLRREVGDADAILETEQSLAQVLGDVGEFEAAAELAETTWKRTRARYGERDDATLDAANVLADAWVDVAPARAESLLLASLAVQEEVHDGPREITIQTLSTLSRAVEVVPERRAESIAFAERAWEQSRALHGPDHPRTVATRGFLGTSILNAGHQTERAVEILRDALRQHMAILGEDHTVTINLQANLASALSTLGELDEARAILRRAAEAAASTKDVDSMLRMSLTYALGRIQMEQGALAAADSTYRALVDQLRAAQPALPDRLGYALHALARVRWARGERSQSQVLLREAITLLADATGEASWTTQVATRAYAEHLLDMGEVDEAIEALERSRQCLVDKYGETSTATWPSVSALSEAYRAKGRLAEAESLLVRFERDAREAVEPDSELVVAARGALRRFQDETATSPGP